MNFLLAFEGLASIAQMLFPMFASVHTAIDPAASNAALTNAAEAMKTAQVIVHEGEKIAAQAVAAGNAAPTGEAKLQVAQAVVQASHDMLVKNGATTATFDEYWGPINTSITTICAASKLAQEVKTALDLPMVS